MFPLIHILIGFGYNLNIYLFKLPIYSPDISIICIRTRNALFFNAFGVLAFRRVQQKIRVSSY